MKNNVLEYLEQKNYSLTDIRGTPMMRLSSADTTLEFVIDLTRGKFFNASRTPTAEEKEILNRIVDAAFADPEKKFIYYDFSLDNSD